MLDAPAAAVLRPKGSGTRGLRPRRLRSGSFTPWFLILPAVILIAFVTLLPMAEAIKLSVYETNFLETGDFVGLKHFRAYLQDPAGRHNIVVTLVFTFGSMALAMPLALALALLLNKPLRGRTFFRTILILPWVISQLLTSILWALLYDPSIGPIGDLLELLGGAGFAALGSAETAMPALIVASVWRSFPYGMILLLAALQTVPRELYDAVEVDGASRWQGFRYVTFPAILPTFLIAMLILSISYVNMVEIPLVLTGGGPAGATEVIGLRVYQEAFRLHNFGFASAVSMLMFAVNIAICAIYIKTLRRSD